MQSGCVPSDFKTAHVKPLLKKPKLQHNDLKNYRPVSNLKFISKILEKAVAIQIKNHLSDHNLANHHQSAYKKYHSTESTLLKLQNDFLLNMDQGRVTALTLLDLSAAFDTIDHSILLNRMSSWFGVNGTALEWFKSYLTDRSQSVFLNGTKSSPMPLSYGVPQGSVLGPLLFTLYTSPLSKIIDGFSLSHHLYSDDTQLYTSFTVLNSNSAIQKLQDCLTQIQSWMNHNKLKLNPSKTEFMLIGHKIQREKFSQLFPISLLGNRTNPNDSVRNLGVLFDSDISFSQHITQVCKTSFYHIRNIKRIRKHLSLSTARSVATALITSKLDYCNSVLMGVAERDLNRLQRVQNCLARVVAKAPRFSRSVPLLQSLHWLPIRARIHFKLGTIIYKAISSAQPPYLSEILNKRNSGRNLRSDSLSNLTIPKTKSITGSRSFSVYAPTYWNTLPYPVRSAKSLTSFRSLQKTHLFRLSFPP